MKLISKLIFFIASWKVIGDPPKQKKFVMIAAPHTSNWDFVYARAAFFIMGIPLKYTIKKELFFFPLGWILKTLGGIPIDRSKRSNTVDAMADLFNQYNELAILVTPEGTRSYSEKWKKGFYYVAQKANVPISLGYLDYSKKHAGIGPLIHPSGNYEEDLETIQSFYCQITPKYPEKGVK